MRKKILFISTVAGVGGSEELWTRTAVFLAKEGVPVAASFQGRPEPDRRISELSGLGVDLRPRPVKPSLIGLARRYASGKGQITVDVAKQSFWQFLAKPCSHIRWRCLFRQSTLPKCALPEAGPSQLLRMAILKLAFRRIGGPVSKSASIGARLLLCLRGQSGTCGEATRP